MSTTIGGLSASEYQLAFNEILARGHYEEHLLAGNMPEVLALLREAHAYLAALDHREKMRGTHYGWITVGEQLDSVRRRIANVERQLQLLG